MKFPVLLCLMLFLCLATISSCTEPNTPPIITGMEVRNNSLELLGNSEIMCVASDADGDPLSYNWSVSGGTFQGQGDIIVWKAPRVPGTYIINVSAADGKGGEAVMQLSLDMGKGRPPTIGGLNISPCTLGEKKEATLECVASDPEGGVLLYSWQIAEKSIAGNGPIIKWTPDETGTYDIVVEVTDDNGNKTRFTSAVEVMRNHEPIITGLVANPSSVFQEQISIFECTAVDPDGDELSYDWEIPAGALSGEGASIQWQAPIDCATYPVKIKVTDGRGGEVSHEMKVRVKKTGG